MVDEILCKKILAILAGMACWVMISPVGILQREQKAHTSVSISLPNLVSETPSTTHRDPQRAVHPILAEYLRVADFITLCGALS